MRSRSPFDEMPELDRSDVRAVCWIGVIALVLVALLVGIKVAEAASMTRTADVMQQACPDGCVMVPKADWDQIVRVIKRCAGERI